MPPTHVYTDGACSGNPGPGGWAWVIPDGPDGSGAELDTTNQRMEVKAVLEALRANPGPLHIHSDSTYVVNCFRDRWHDGWRKRGWKNSQRKPVANRDLWEPLLDEALPRLDAGELEFSWVKGHSGDPMNELADRLAVSALQDLVGLEGAGSPTAKDDSATPDPAVPWPIGPALLVVGSSTPTTEQEKGVREAVRSLAPETVVVTGLRRGTELVAAEEALRCRLRLAVVLPFPDPAVHWPDELRARFDAALARAEFDVVLEGDPSTPGTAVQLRNRWFERAAAGAVIVGDPTLAERLTGAGLSVVEVA